MKTLLNIVQSQVYKLIPPCLIFLVLAWIFITLTASTRLHAQRLTRDYNVDLLVNQAGYLSNAPKTVVVKGTFSRSFDVVDVTTQKVVFTGNFNPKAGDFGIFSTGEFSDVSTNGVYYILSDTLRSVPFQISENVYEPAMDLIIHYFSRQRCGASTTGYLTPCHMDDGVRIDNSKHQDVSGGWHDASDLRKWVGATIYGMIGIAKTYELSTNLDHHKLLDELKWGNRYFLHMQEPQGYIMSYVGGDVLKHSDSNRWTDNVVGEDEGVAHFTKPNTGKSTADMLIVGTMDDRVIKTDPLDIMGQYNFVTAEAIMARITKNLDDAYSARCLEAATSCFSWCKTVDRKLNPGAIGASIQAALELYKTTGKDEYKSYAIRQAAELKNLQDVNDSNKISGFYYTGMEKTEPYKNIWNGCMEFYALSDLAILFPDHENTALWKEMISSYAYRYLKVISDKNSFGIVPFGLYTGQDPGGNKKIGDYWYRYFMRPELDWWVGVNSNLAASGIGFVKAAKVLNDPKLLAYAQYQLNWIIGANPFNSSTLIGIGHNHPTHFPGSTFYPQTPVIYGAVMNGLGGDHEDQPVIGTGNWQISEYWTPMVAHTIWLMAELSAN